MPYRRFAIYHLPAGPLGEFGGAWLGWDAREGRALPRPEIAGLPDEAETLTAQPMRYGFHATLKAPFRLAEGHSPEDLAARAERVCDHLVPFALELELRRDWGFVALRPRRQPPELMALEQVLVTRLDDLRAALTPEERERRKPDALPAGARRHLDHWGYPFVLDQFQYHLTLSNGLPSADAQALCHALAPVLAPLIRAPMPVQAVALMGEDAEGRFHMIREIALRG
ncbi:MAG: DUF1045 domain-containing protein [Paracoccus sp. (in: a-proteobacteria)]|uniref:DUF1045 domain-containing protein n=1 Tax=Paracoccus sp. TaxID=267 RepID=UPI0039E6290F